MLSNKQYTTIKKEEDLISKLDNIEQSYTPGTSEYKFEYIFNNLNTDGSTTPVVSSGHSALNERIRAQKQTILKLNEVAVTIESKVNILMAQIKGMESKLIECVQLSRINPVLNVEESETLNSLKRKIMVKNKRRTVEKNKREDVLEILGVFRKILQGIIGEMEGKRKF